MSHSYELTDEALQNLENMQRRVWDIGNLFGYESAHYLQALNSMHNAMLTIFRWPGKVMAEDDLSLIINSRITIGVIWHPLRKDGERDELLGTWSCHS